jgi:hypothetical protein
MGVTWRACELGIVCMPTSRWRARQGGIQVSTQCIEGHQRTASTRLCTRTRAVLHRGLDGVLSAVLARPAEWGARGFVAELLVRYLICRSDGGS